MNPENALGAGSIFEKVWKCDTFRSRILSIIWDEGHCVSAWSKFRKDYKEAGKLRLSLGRHIPFYAASATFPNEVLTDVMSQLRMQRETTTFIERSNDRPNVYLSVRRIQYALDSFKDLDFLIPKDWRPGTPLPQFLIFFDDITESIAAAKHLRSLLPKEHRHLIKWFNSEMTPAFRERTSEEFRNGIVWYVFHRLVRFGESYCIRCNKISLHYIILTIGNGRTQRPAHLSVTRHL